MQQLTDIQQVNHAIMFGQWTNIEIQSMVDAIKFARANLARQNKRAFKVGDTVKFTSSRNGRTYTGTVDKIKIKFVLVNTPQGRYNVPASMLEAA
jgi:hypothetical protein